jgi:hypothetical protein
MNLYQFVKLFQDKLGNYKQKPLGETLWYMGDGSGNLYPYSGNYNVVWVRNKLTGATAWDKVYNQKVQNIPDKAVMVGTDPDRPRLRQITKDAQAYGITPPYPEIPPGISSILKAGGIEPLNIDSEQILPWLVIPDASNPFAIDIYAAVGFSDSSWVLPTSTSPTILDLTSYVPSSGAYVVAVYMNGDGSFSVNNSGATTASIVSLATANFGVVPSGKQAVCFVRLFAGQTNIRQDVKNNYTDIIDIRFVNTIGGSGGGGGTPGGSDTYVQVNKTGAFYGDNNFIYLYASRNWILNWAGVTPYNLSNDDVHFAAEGDSPAFAAWIFYSGLSPTATTGARFIATAARGTKASPTALQAGDSIGGLSFKPFDGVLSGGNMSNLRTNAQIVGRVLNNQSSTDHSTEIDIYTTPSGTATEVLAVTIKNDGSLDMKTHTVTNVKLDRHNSLL